MSEAPNETPNETPNEAVVVIGGTSGLGKEVARHYASKGFEVVLSGRETERAQSVALEVGGTTTGIAIDLTKPKELAAGLSAVGPVKHLVLAAMERDNNLVKDYNIEAAIGLVVSKLVGYSEVIHTLSDRLVEDSSILLFGGQAREKPYPGSTTVTTVNGGVTALVRSLAIQLAPTRVNAIHPGIVGDSPYWSGKNVDGVIARTPGGRLATMEDVTGAVAFLLENRGVNGVNLNVDGGWMLT